MTLVASAYKNIANVGNDPSSLNSREQVGNDPNSFSIREYYQCG